MVGDDDAGLAAARDQPGQLARDAPTRDRGVGDCRQALPRHVVDDVEHAATPAAGELVVHDIERPSRVALRLEQDRRPCPDRTTSGATPADGETVLAIAAVDPVDARGLALPPQQDEQPPVAEATPLVGELA
jgi:hypothetical protein